MGHFLLQGNTHVIKRKEDRGEQEGNHREEAAEVLWGSLPLLQSRGPAGNSYWEILFIRLLPAKCLAAISRSACISPLLPFSLILKVPLISIICSLALACHPTTGVLLATVMQLYICRYFPLNAHLAYPSRKAGVQVLIGLVKSAFPGWGLTQRSRRQSLLQWWVMLRTVSA